MKPLTLLRTLVLATPVALGGCGYWDAREAHRAQFEMVGMTTYDLQACAGMPNKTQKLNDSTSIWQYDVTRSVPAMQDNGFFPVGSVVKMYQSFVGGPGSNCHMFLRINHDRIAEIHYSGDNDEYIGVDGICSLITRGCARQRESTMHRAPGIFPFGPISAFHSAKTPPQSADATYSTESGQYIPQFTDINKPVIQKTEPPPANKK
ncbi:hypothetical protein GS501_00435 [Saccharibacter sp. 17.LH.SD]|uniref:hypothetical protein n=1 Tax=Saccharibacter sp. 17.LH.SD TaxID=2689393 RepID=UPI00136FFB37|nr:hypothetical protein [Saccharibacter sp. 17.LH.SD]MXV43545.1 hypothetical protein [Saccharibacter sp. 17.LH.SD]